MKPDEERIISDEMALNYHLMHPGRRQRTDVHERDNVAWFYTRQVWRLKWQGTREEFVMRMTGVLEKVDQLWMFSQIHASMGVSAP